MKRRTFLGSALASAAATAIGRQARAAEAAAKRWDYLIIGAGSAGLPAACLLYTSDAADE